MRKKSIVLFLFIFSCTCILNAQNLPSTLLWKISGNGLQRPSYLYGTMHLTDEKIFNIGDSVYKAIENSEGFAIEIDPVEFTPLIIDETKKSYLEARHIKEMLNKKDFEKYGKALAKKLKKDEDDITTADILRQKNKWIEDSYRTGKMQTFLDVYLFDIARRQGKWTGGVEDLQDQEDVMDYLVDESDIQELVDEDVANKQYNQELNRLINLYVNNDLEAIKDLSSSDDSLHEDVLFIRRNKKMAMRMDSLSHERSMVFAVGAAHLPGDQGLIMLLKQKGFTVTPVFSSKKIKPKDYTVAEISLPWYDVKDESGYYTASMPGKAGNLTLYGILNMKMYFDVFTSTLYMASALRTPYSESMADSVFGVMVNYYFETDDFSKGKPITINNVKGREFQSDKDNFSHGYFLFKDGMMYMAIGVCMKKDTSAEASINRFIHSYTILENDKKDNETYFTYTDKENAYQLDLPAEPASANDFVNLSEDTSFTRDIKIVTDPQSGAYLFFGFNQTARGFYIENDSDALAKIKESQRNKFSVIGVDTMYIKNNHRVMEFGGMMAEAPLMMKAHYEFRGNRWYALIAMYDPAKTSPSVQRFFSSFTMLDYPAHEWNQYAAEDKLFTTWAPSKFKFIANPSSENLDIIHEYESFDTSRADTYSLVITDAGKYYWQTSDSALWEKIIHRATSYNDSLLSKKPVSNGEASGIEITIQEHGSGNIKRKRILLNGGKIYTLLTVKAAGEIYNDNTNKFFEEFRFSHITANSDLFVSKASLLLNDLSSSDSAVRAEASGSLYSAPFTKGELPMLHEALLKKYPSEDDYQNPKESLKKIIIDLKDTASLSFAKNNYLLADTETQILLLEIMASFPTLENFDNLKTILLEHPPQKKPGYSFAYAFADSLQLAANVFPGFLPLLKDTMLAPSIMRIARHLLDSNLINASLLDAYQPDILRLSQKQYLSVKNDPDNYDYISYSIVYVLEKMNNDACNAALQNWSRLKQPDLQLEAVSALLRNKQTVDQQVLQHLASDKSIRTSLFDSLSAYKKEILFPKQYLTQKYFAESYAYLAASDDEEPSDLIFLTQKTINFKGRQSRFFFFKVSYEYDDGAYYSLACAGPFTENSTDVSARNATGDLYYDEDFDPENLQAQMDALIKQMEDWYKWADEKND